MIHIKQLRGTESDLYQLVAPLVMNPTVLKQNNNFPFRTSEKFEWFVGLNDEDHVIGFVPVECRRRGYIINNYYIENKDAEVLTVLVKKVISVFPDKELSVVAFRDDENIFHLLGFMPDKQWTRYVKMKKEPDDAKK